MFLLKEFFIRLHFVFKSFEFMLMIFLLPFQILVNSRTSNNYNKHGKKLKGTEIATSCATVKHIINNACRVNNL